MSPQTVEDITDSAAEIAALAKRQLAAYNAANLDDFCACYHPDVKVLDASGEATMQGMQTFRERYGALFTRFQDVRGHVTTRVACGPECVDLEVWSRIDAQTGARSEGTVLVRYRLRDGRIGTVQFLT